MGVPWYLLLLVWLRDSSFATDTLDFYTENGQFNVANSAEFGVVKYFIKNQIVKEEQLETINRYIDAIKTSNDYGQAVTDTGTPLKLKTTAQFFQNLAENFVRLVQRQNQELKLYQGTTPTAIYGYVNCTVKRHFVEFDIGNDLIVTLGTADGKIPALDQGDIINTTCVKYMKALKTLQQVNIALDHHLSKLKTIYFMYLRLLQQTPTEEQITDIEVYGACNMQKIAVQNVECKLVLDNIDCVILLYELSDFEVFEQYKTVPLHGYQLAYNSILRNDNTNDSLISKHCAYTTIGLIHYGCVDGDLPDNCANALVSRELGPILEYCNFIYQKPTNYIVFERVTVFYVPIEETEDDYFDIKSFQFPPPIGLILNARIWVSAANERVELRPNSQHKSIIRHYLSISEIATFRSTLDKNFYIWQILNHRYFLPSTIFSTALSMFILMGVIILNKARKRFGRDKLRATYMPMKAIRRNPNPLSQ